MAGYLAYAAFASLIVFLCIAALGSRHRNNAEAQTEPADAYEYGEH